jgi:polar amino acid transport system substrate-binding protein
MNQENVQTAPIGLKSNVTVSRSKNSTSDVYAEWTELRLIRPQQLIRAFLSQMKLLDPALLRHTRSVTYYTLLVARHLNLEQKDKRELLYSTLLHDVGKIGLDRRIIEKKEKCTPEEWEIIRAHPINGQKILSFFPCFLNVGPIIRHHHERFDGTGYPDGLAGEQIPFKSGLIAIVDAFVAMTNVRAYQASLNVSDALETIVQNKGKQFDPKLADIFVTVIIENLKRRAAREQKAPKPDTDAS